VPLTLMSAVLLRLDLDNAKFDGQDLRSEFKVTGGNVPKVVSATSTGSFLVCDLVAG